MIQVTAAAAESPGRDPLMLIDVTTPVKPGDEVTFTLTLKDGGVSMKKHARPAAPGSLRRGP